jgi:hypothetical protein
MNPPTLSAVVLAVIASAAVTSAAGAASAPATRAAWQSVLSDVAAHGRLTGQHSCATVVVARTHAPPRYTEGSPVVHTLDAFLYMRCRKFGRVHSLRVGMTNSQVVNIAGAPVPWLSGPTCWVYRGRTFDALRVCFIRSRVASLGFAVHG